MAYRGETFWKLWRLLRNDEISFSDDNEEIFAHSRKAERILKETPIEEKQYFLQTKHNAETILASNN